MGNWDGKLEGGQLIYFKNEGTIKSPAFVGQSGDRNPFNALDVGTFSSPAFVDIDADGDGNITKKEVTQSRA